MAVGAKTNSPPKKSALRHTLSKALTGIDGFDQITQGGLPKGRPSLICGSAGCGKTLFAMEFLIRGAVEFGEPGIFFSFEEREKDLLENTASFGFNLNQLQKQKKLCSIISPLKEMLSKNPAPMIWKVCSCVWSMRLTRSAQSASCWTPSKIFFNEKLKISEQKLEESLYELTLANIKLKKRDEAKTMFMAMASHDLRNPLCIVKSYTDLLMETPNPGPQTAKEYLVIISKSAQRMQRLISSLFDISRIDLGKMPVNLNVKQDVNRILEKCLSAHRTVAEKKAISMKTLLGTDLAGVYGDQDRLYQLFDNLISNALKYTPRDGEIVIETKNSLNDIEVSIQDNGIGMDELDLDRIFEPFTRLQSSGLEGEESTGLGLTVVKKIVEAHGGAVEVHSQIGKGSTFVVTLPIKLKSNGTSQVTSPRSEV